jgi:hypothetical protein
LSDQNAAESLIGGVLILCNGCVLMESVYFWVWILRKAFDVFDVSLVLGELWSLVDARW